MLHWSENHTIYEMLLVCKRTIFSLSSNYSPNAHAVLPNDAVLQSEHSLQWEIPEALVRQGTVRLFEKSSEDPHVKPESKV